jgi:hypothetical protein
MKRYLPSFVLVPLSVVAALSASSTAQAVTYSCSAGTTCFIGTSTVNDVIAGSFQSTACVGGAANGYDTTSGVGVWGGSASGVGVVGVVDDSGFVAPAGKYGVYGYDASGAGFGLYGLTNGAGRGVYGQATAGWGVYGYDSTTGTGVYGNSSTGNGVRGDSANTSLTAAKAGIYGHNNSGGLAGYFDGAVNIAAGSLYFAGTCYAGPCTSDRRLKQNIEPLKGALDQLVQLKGVTYEWKDPAEQGANQEGKHTGFIAQDVENVFPKWIGENAKGFKTLTIPPTQLAALEVESIRTLKAQNEALEERVKALEANRRPLISGLTAEGTLFGFGLVTMAGAFVVSRRKRSDSENQG